jgi:hypothetical protein
MASQAPGRETAVWRSSSRLTRRTRDLSCARHRGARCAWLGTTGCASGVDHVAQVIGMVRQGGHAVVCLPSDLVAAQSPRDERGRAHGDRIELEALPPGHSTSSGRGTSSPRRPDRDPRTRHRTAHPGRRTRWTATRPIHRRLRASTAGRPGKRRLGEHAVAASVSAAAIPGWPVHPHPAPGEAAPGSTTRFDRRVVRTPPNPRAVVAILGTSPVSITDSPQV